MRISGTEGVHPGGIVGHAVEIEVLLPIDGLDLPAGEDESVGDDPRAGPQLAPELIHQPVVGVLSEIDRDNVGFAQVLGEEVAPNDASSIAQTLGREALPRPEAPQGVNLDADGPRAEVPSRGEQDTPVAGSQVVDDVVRLHLGELQHTPHPVPGRGQPRGSGDA